MCRLLVASVVMMSKIVMTQDIGLAERSASIVKLIVSATGMLSPIGDLGRAYPGRPSANNGGSRAPGYLLFTVGVSLERSR